jgi:hypothetical protein
MTDTTTGRTEHTECPERTRRAEGLRAWAAGSYATSAAAELLIRFGPPLLTGPWVEHDPDRGRYRFNTDAVEEHALQLSGGERRVLEIAASLAVDWYPVALSDAVAGIEREHLDLVLAAIAHAAGSHEHARLVWVDHADAAEASPQLAGFHTLTSLYPWPEDRPTDN